MAGVEPGAPVWTNRASFAHEVTAAQFHDAAPDWDLAVEVEPDESASHSFDAAGVSEYTCTIHGKSSMCGAVLVGDDSLDETLPCEGSRGHRGRLTRSPRGSGLPSPSAGATR